MWQLLLLLLVYSDLEDTCDVKEYPQGEWITAEKSVSIAGQDVFEAFDMY